MSFSTHPSPASSTAGRGDQHPVRLVASYLACVALIVFVQLRFDRLAVDIVPPQAAATSTFAMSTHYSPHALPLRANSALDSRDADADRQDALDAFRQADLAAARR